MNNPTSIKFPSLFLVMFCNFCYGKSIDIDVGHSLSKSGAISYQGKNEFLYNRALGLELNNELLGKGVITKLIGGDGLSNDLMTRTKNNNGEVFVSIHHDSIKKEWMNDVDQFKGFSIFISRKNKELEKSKTCAIAVGREMVKTGFRPSLYHAMDVDGERKELISKELGVHYYDDLIVLKHNKHPSILVEAGVIVNKNDELRVTSDVGRSLVAKAISSGLINCLESFQH